MPKLPPELYRLIIEEVEDRAALSTLLLTSRALHREAERRVYRNITAFPDQNPILDCVSTKDKELLREMLFRVVQSPRLGSYLVYLNLHKMSSRDRSFDSEWQDYMPAVARICYNPKPSHMPLFPVPSFVPPVNACFRLHKFIFDCNCLWSTGPGGDNEVFSGIGPFLESQPDIVQLALPSWFHMKPLTSQCLPNLRILLGPIHICLWLLAKRKVEELELINVDS